MFQCAWRAVGSHRRNLAVVEPGFFEIVRDAFEGFVAGVGGKCNIWVHGRGMKVWFDDETREHYEAQLIRVDGEVQLEIGFHAEHPKAPQNTEVVRRLVAAQSTWRKQLGDEAEAGDFIGRAGWQRISEVWPVPGASEVDGPDVDEAIEAAARLADYVRALEPVRRRTAAAASS